MTKKKKPIRLGVVHLEWQYVIDLDDDEMIERAKIALLEDIRSYVILSPGELDEFIVAVPSSEAKESDINDWLFDEGDAEGEENP
jgi:hypothetical protein